MVAELVVAPLGSTAVYHHDQVSVTSDKDQIVEETMGHLTQGLAEQVHDVIYDEAREGVLRTRHRTVSCGMLVDGVAPQEKAGYTQR